MDPILTQMLQAQSTIDSGRDELATARAEIADLRAQVARLSTVTEDDVERVANTPEVRKYFCGACKAYKEHEDAVRAALSAFVARASAKAG